MVRWSLAVEVVGAPDAPLRKALGQPGSSFDTNVHISNGSTEVANDGENELGQGSKRKSNPSMRV